MRTVLIFILLFTTTVIFTGCGQSFADSRAPGNQDFQRGKAYYARQDYQSAITSFQRAVDSNPDGWLFRNWIGMSYFNLKQYNQAITNLEISNKGRETPSNHYFIAESNYHIGNYDAAIKHYERFIEMGKDNDLAHYFLGLSYLKKGHYHRAIAEFNHANQMKRSIRNDAGIAKAYMGMKDYASAAPYLKKWALSDSSNGEAHQLLGITYTNLKVYDEAIKEFQRANLIKETAQSYEGLGDIYCKLQQHKNASKAYLKAISLTKSNTSKDRIMNKYLHCKK